jgi:hypothetical protein
MLDRGQGLGVRGQTAALDPGRPAADTPEGSAYAA